MPPLSPSTFGGGSARLKSTSCTSVQDHSALHSGCDSNSGQALPTGRYQPSDPHPVVIADANPWIRRELALNIRQLRGAVTIHEARSPSEVLAHIADPRCAMLVIDPCMPTVGQTDGMPLLRRICCLRRDLKILVLARHPQHLLRDKALPRQISHVYGKNISAAWLCRLVHRALAQPEAA